MIKQKGTFIAVNENFLPELNKIMEVEASVNTSVEKEAVFVDENHLFLLNMKSHKVPFSLNASSLITFLC